jgi:hypothetical protein
MFGYSRPDRRVGTAAGQHSTSSNVEGSTEWIFLPEKWDGTPSFPALADTAARSLPEWTLMLQGDVYIEISGRTASHYRCADELAKYRCEKGEL